MIIFVVGRGNKWRNLSLSVALKIHNWIDEDQAVAIRGRSSENIN